MKTRSAYSQTDKIDFNCAVHVKCGKCTLDEKYFSDNPIFSIERDKFNADENRIGFYAMDNGKMVGFVLCSANNDYLVIRFMYVEETFRGLGVIQKMLNGIYNGFGKLIGYPVDLRAMIALKKAGFRVESNGMCVKE